MKQHDPTVEQIPPITGHIPPPSAEDAVREPRGEEPTRASEGSEAAADLGLLLLTVIWGVNFAVIKFALDELHPLSFNALRFPIASAVVFAILRIRGPLRIPERRHWPALLVLGLLGNTLYQFFFIYGIDGTGAGNAALLLATTPVWTILLSTLLGHERASGIVWIGAGGTIAGMMLVIAGGNAGLEFSGDTLLGDLLMVGGSMVWAGYTVGARPLIGHYGSLQVTAWTLWAGTIGILVVGAVPVARTDLATVSGGAWAGIFYAGALAVGLAYALWNRGIGRIGNARTSVYSNLVPVVALLVAWIWLGEVPAVLQAAGAAVILASLFLARFGGRSRRRAVVEARGTRREEVPLR